MTIPAGDFVDMYACAYAAFPEWLEHLRTLSGRVAVATVAACESDLDMASAIFAAGYATAWMDYAAAPGSGREG